ncbi:MAG TPA: V-type ATP synthase subunit I [Clostridia bacterium]|nr:V-type ATP synthase subunit I [Clostridia bacterium]
MKKVVLIGMESEKDRILKTIQSMENLEIAGLEEWKQDQEEHPFEELVEDEDLESSDLLKSQLSGIEYTLQLIGQYSPLKEGLFHMKPEVDSGVLLEALEDRDETFKIVDKCKGLEDTLNGLILQETRLDGIIEQMKPWRDLNIPLEKIKDTPTTRVTGGTVNKSEAARFSEGLNALESELLFAERLEDSGDDTCFFIIYHKSMEEDISSVFNEFAFSRSSFADLEGTPTQIIGRTEKQLEGIQEEKAKIKEQIIDFSSSRQDLQLLYDALLIETHRYDVVYKLMKTQHTFLLTGWVPTEDADGFRDVLRNEFDDLYIKCEDPAPDETFPVKLENNAFATPFEMVTDLYSTPNSRELDPNSIMAPFYAIFFGIMMGDAGYGLVMAIASYFFIKKMRPKDGTKKLAGVIMIGGMFTFVWGAIFGGWFGDAGALAGIKPIWFNPMDEPIKMLVVCFAMGVIHVFAGIGVKAYVNISKGKILDAVFDQGLWYVLYTGLILWLAGGMANLGVAFSQTGKIMTIVGAIGLILTQGRDKKNIFMKLFSGIASLYDVTGFLSDILSYSRLFALALTTGVIGMVMNQLGAMLGTSWYGWIFASIVLIVGHTFNIVINVLGAFVHTSRLQYIEFYGQFFEGGGKNFRPLGMETKYTDIKR